MNNPAPTFDSICNGADPWVFPMSGNYVEPQGWGYLGGKKNGLYIKVFEEFDGLAAANEFKIWPKGQASVEGKKIRDFWAPESHFINGRWYVYFAATNSGNEGRRMWVIESGGQSPLGPYELKGKISSDDDNWAIDMTVFQHEGQLYAVWSGWESPTAEFPQHQHLYIAKMETPWKISGERVRISSPVLQWEKSVHPINEGPQVVIANGNINIIYSADASWTPHYKLGLIYTPMDADLMDGQMWKKKETPVFEQGKTKYKGPGHACFINHPTRGWLNIFHYKKSAHWGWNNRVIAVQQMAWDSDGLPQLGV